MESKEVDKLFERYMRIIDEQSAIIRGYQEKIQELKTVLEKFEMGYAIQGLTPSQVREAVDRYRRDTRLNEPNARLVEAVYAV